MFFSGRAKHYSCFPLYMLILKSAMSSVFFLLGSDMVNMRLKYNAFPMMVVKPTFSNHGTKEIGIKKSIPLLSAP